MMHTNASAEDHAVATALVGVSVRGERNLLAETAIPGLTGARAALETFYHAFNTRSLDLARQIWANDPLVQLVSPIAGVVRGSAGIAALYARGFAGPAQVMSVLEDIVAYVTPELVVFAGREHGTFMHDMHDLHDLHDREDEVLDERPEIRTACICTFRFIAAHGGWRQVYHHVSLDDADQLARFQRSTHST